ncbi:MAG TPA: hypothetical protein VLT36_17435 [Candidatus Dormibacteraeota bacterium]|nr:hypothetical protein [Candidatus Dormibacteraeota bacterium]
MERFEREVQTLPALREEHLRKVVRWVHSTEELWSCWDLREKAPEDSALPGPEGALYAYGFDQSGRRIAVREFKSNSVWVRENERGPGSRSELLDVPTKDVFREHLISYEGDWVDVSVLKDGLLSSVHRSRFQDRLLTESESFGDGFYGRQVFQYEGRRKKRLQCFSHNERLDTEIHYGPHGEQTFFRVRRDGTLFQLGQPLPKGMTPKKLKATIRDRLLLLIPQVVGAAKIDEPIYCVALAYDGEGNDVLPPGIAIGVDSERSKWLREHGAEARDWLWNPAEFYHYEKPHTQFEDEPLEKACDLLNTHLAERDGLTPATRLLVEVAAELNKLLWPANVRRTEDFVVYAVDLELGRLQKNMKACLAPDRLSDLKARRLL